MAKDREGSVNIYGAMQAKTAQGIVAYTDGIAHEKEDGTVINLNEMLKNGVGGGGSAIVDVEKLVYSSWIGTTFPNSGVCPDLYLNTNLSISEVITILKQIEYNDLGNGGFAYFPCFAEYNDPSVFVQLSIAFINGQYVISKIIGESEEPIFSTSIDFVGFEGWNSEFDGVIRLSQYNANLTDTFGAGLQNDKLSSLFSTTPFVKGEEPKDNVFYRLNIPGAKVVPDSGYIEKVYVNKNLTNEEINEILKGLNYTYIEAFNSDIVVLTSDSTMEKAIVITYFPIDEQYTIFAYFDYVNIGGTNIQVNNLVPIYDSSIGWSKDDTTGDVMEIINWEINVGYENALSLLAPSFGVPIQNDKLSELFSITPNFGKPKSELYTYKNGEYKKVYPQLPIVDVEQLPGAYTGTALKEGSTVVYFNTDASYEQIYNWISSQTGWVNTGDFEMLPLGAIKIDNDYIPGLLLMRIYAENSYMYMLAAMEFPLWVDEVAAKFLPVTTGVPCTKGWNLDLAASMAGISFTPLNLALFGASISITDGTNDYTNTYNNLSWLASATEYTPSGPINDSIIYRLKSNTASDKYVGNAIPNNGLIEKIYFNTEMSNEEVYSLLSTLTTFKDNDMGDTYIILAAGPNSTTNYQLLSIWGGHVLMLTDKNDSSQSKIIWVSPQYIADNNITAMSAGWQGINNQSMYLFPTDSATVTLQGDSTATVSVGTENEKISSLVSWSPFLKVPGEPKYDLYYYKDKYIKLLQEGDIKLDNAITLNQNEDGSIIITQSQYDFIKNTDDVTVIVKASSDGLYIDTYYSNKFVSNINGEIIELYGFYPSGNYNYVSRLTIASDLSITTKLINLDNDFSIESFNIANDYLTLKVKKGNSGQNFNVNIDTTPTNNSNHLISSKAVFTALQSYPKTTEVNQMIADYITTNFENGDEGSY